MDKNNSKIASLTQAIELNQNYDDIYQLGLIYWSIGKYDEAIQDFTRVSNIQPTNSKIYFWRAMAYREKRDYDHAIADLNRSAEINPSDYMIFSARGDVYSEKGEFEKAIADYTRAIELGHDYSLISRGLAFESLGKKVKAKTDYEKFISSTNNRELRRQIRQLLKNLGTE